MDTKDIESSAMTRYLVLRRTQVKLNSELIRRLPKSVIIDSAKRLELWQEDGRIGGNDSEMAALTDFCLYDHGADGANVIANLLAGAEFTAESDETLVVGAMLQSPPLSLYRIEQPRKELGVELRDLLTGEELFVVDQALGQTGWAGAYLATRVLRVEAAGLNMTSGAALGVREAMAEGVADDVHAEIGEGAADVVAKMSRMERSRLAVRLLREAFRDAWE
jgi:hypothetical protein